MVVGLSIFSHGNYLFKFNIILAFMDHNSLYQIIRCYLDLRLQNPYHIKRLRMLQSTHTNIEANKLKFLIFVNNNNNVAVCVEGEIVT